MDLNGVAMHVVVQYGIKLLYSGVLLGGLYLFAYEIYRVWFDRTLVLAPFEYLKDGVESRESGQSFTRRVSHDLLRLQELYSGNDRSGDSIPSTDQLGRGRELNIPVATPNVLPEIEIKAYGIQVTELLRRLSRSIRRPHELVGNVSERNGRFDAYAEIRNPNETKETSSHWHISGREGMDDLSYDLACRILLELAANQAPKLFGIGDGGKPVTVNEFCGFLLGLESYRRYRELLAAVEGNDRAEIELKRTKQIVENLIGRDVRLPFSHKLAGFVLNDAGKPSNALKEIDKYIDILSATDHTDESARLLRESLIVETRRELPTATIVEAHSRVRPLRPGISISSKSGQTIGSLTGVVRNEAGRRYVLTAAHVIPDEIGSYVQQPAAPDGGESDDQIGILAQKLGSERNSDDNTVAALVEIFNDIEAENTIPGRGWIGSPIDVVPDLIGSKVFIIGRSGTKEGVVKEIDFDMQIHLGPGQPTTFQDLIVTSRASEPGDSGAVVITPDNKVLGFVFAASDNSTIVMPLKPVLGKLRVEWLSPNHYTSTEGN